MATTIRVCLLLLSGLYCRAQDYEEETVLKVTPSGIAVETGETIELTCTHYPEDLDADLKLDWFMPDPNGQIPISQLVMNQSVINETNSDILRFSSENGTLTIVNSSSQDSGTYLCKHLEADLEVEAIVKVYTMPSYFTEAMVVLSINGVLIVIFISCSIWTFIRNRKEAKIKKRQAKLGHRDLAKRALND